MLMVADALEELTPREHEVLALIAEGLSNKAIRERLYIAPKTLERHICNIFTKLEVDRPDDGYNPRVLAVLTWRQERIAVAH
jgi:DNA-binding NarL/FixJ family response regulator